MSECLVNVGKLNSYLLVQFISLKVFLEVFLGSLPLPMGKFPSSNSDLLITPKNMT